MTAAQVLKYTVVVRHPETLEATPLLAGEAVPSWAKGLVQSDDLESKSESKS